MNPAIHAAIHAAVIEEQRKRESEEEEKMAQYHSDDLNDWEFKIVRSASGAFRKPDVLETLLEEEALAGWEMVEKFDDRRVRFKRPLSARKKDIFLSDGFDPYRTDFGSSIERSLLISLIFGVGALVAGLVVYLFFSGSDPVSEMPIAIVTIILMIMVLMAVRFRRGR